MTYEESMKLVEWMNKKFLGWYKWATAKPWSWEKIKSLKEKYGKKN